MDQGVCSLIGGHARTPPAAPNRATPSPLLIFAAPLLLFAAALVSCFVAALVDLWIRLPIYSTCKGTYLLGLSPAFGVLAAAGCEPLLRWRWTRVGLLTILGSWATAVHVAFWCVKF